MRRRSKRNQTAAEPKNESSRKSSRISKRKKAEDEVQQEKDQSDSEIDKSSISVKTDEENDSVQESEDTEDVKNDASKENVEEKVDESEKIDSNDQNNIDKSDSKVDKNDSTEQEEHKEKDEEDIKGKSTGLSNSNNEQSSNTIEPVNESNENVQGSPPSPKNNDETVKNNETTNDETGEVVEVNNAPTETKKSEENDNQETPFESEYNQVDSDKSKEVSNGEMGEKPIENSEIKESSEKKRIVLRRSPIDKSKRGSSPLEDGEIQEPKEKSRKITLKRRTTEETNSEIDKIVIINKRSVSVEENTEKRKRLTSATEENILTVVGKPCIPPKIIKLSRNFSQENEESEIQQRSFKPSWGKSEFFDNLSSNVYKIDVESIKVICPNIEFLKEHEVKLEETPKERLQSHSEEKMDYEDYKSEEESDKEKSEAEDSSEEQKIETNANIIAMNRKISIVEDTAGKMKPPPSPAKNAPSPILYITNLVRPFTIKQLKELLERTGKIKDDGFWTDKIKSKCFVYYESVEEAEATRNALHGVYWPIGNGKQLIIDFSTEEDMEAAKNAAVQPVAVEKLPEKENREPELDRHKEKDLDKEERRRDTSGREWDKSRDEHHRKHSRSRSKERARKHSRRSYTPEDHASRKKIKSGEEAAPQKLMDDLFLKTKAMPSIYWQPLSPQEIATKQQQRLVRMEEHKRRVKESRSRRDRDRRAPFRRR